VCGIAGYALPAAEERTVGDLLTMCRAMAHRGPDDEGLEFFLGNQPVVPRGSNPASTPHAHFAHDLALGHRRFSIIDPSPAGHQPFWAEDRTACLAINGEIYNYIELRGQLQQLGYSFHTSSDTEVLMQAYRAWGTDMLVRLRGFWSFALYDLRKRAVLLSRDPLGKAALYIVPLSRGVAWASEIKALRNVAKPGAFTPRAQAIDDFVRHGWRDLDHRTSYEDVVTLPAGSFAWIEQGRLGRPTRYWQLPSARVSEQDLSIPAAAEKVRELLFQSVERRLRADVPLGCDLSGGLDSSSIAAAIAETGRHIATYTVKFDEAHSDEEPFARVLAKRYPQAIEYHVLRPPREAFWESANDYVALMDEPFHSPNLFTNFSILKLMAGRGLRVSLSGGAGDEVFAGYSSDFALPYIRHLLRNRMVGRGLKELLAHSEWPAGLLLAKESKRRLRLWMSRSEDGGLLRTRGARTDSPRTDLQGLLLDLMSNWRMNYWLRSGHQSCMGVPMEVRAPFMDVDLVDYVFRLPVTYLIRDGWHKWILRKAMAPLLPEQITWRKRKMGFPFPIREWLAHSKNVFFGTTRGLDCPFLDADALRERYDSLSQTNPNYLWRAMSVALWWKRCVLGEELR